MLFSFCFLAFLQVILAAPLPLVVTRYHEAATTTSTQTYVTGTTTIWLPPVEIFISNGITYTFTKYDGQWATTQATSTSVYTGETSAAGQTEASPEVATPSGASETSSTGETTPVTVAPTTTSIPAESTPAESTPAESSPAETTPATSTPETSATPDATTTAPAPATPATSETPITSVTSATTSSAGTTDSTQLTTSSTSSQGETTSSSTPASNPTTVSTPTTTSSVSSSEETTESTTTSADQTPTVSMSTASTESSSQSTSTTPTTTSTTPTTTSTTSSTTSSTSTTPTTTSTTPTTTSTTSTTPTTTSTTPTTTSTTPTTTSTTPTTTSTTSTSTTSTTTSTSTSVASGYIGAPSVIVYSPYANDGSCKAYNAIETDLKLIKSKGINKIRLYGADCLVTTAVLPLCAQLGITVNQGFWISSAGVDSIDEYVSSVVSWAQTNGWSVFDFFTVGNEAVNEGYCTVSELIAKIASVKAILNNAGWTGQITTSEPPVSFINNPSLCTSSDIDFVGVNPHSYFNANLYAYQAGEYITGQQKQVAEICGKTAFITETGYPHKGDAYGNNVPSDANQLVALQSIMQYTGGDVTILTTYDDMWKNPGPHGIEQYFGMINLIQS